MGVARDLVLLHQLEHAVGRGAGELGQALAAFGAEPFDNFVRIELQPRNHLPAIAPRRPPARPRRIDHDDALAKLRRPQRRRQAGDPGADDG